MSLLDYVYPVEGQLSLVEQAINYAVSATNNILYRTDLNSPYRVLVEAQVYVYNQFLQRLSDVNYELTILFFRILGFEARAARASRAILKFELVNVAQQNVYFRQGFPVRATNGIIFLTDNPLAITAGAKIGYVGATATTEGLDGNVPALTINQPLQQIEVPFSVTNESPASDGQNGETLRELEVRVSDIIRKNGLVTEDDYIRFVREKIPTAVVSATSPNPGEINVYCSYYDGNPFTPSDQRWIENELNTYKMLGVSRLTVSPIETLTLYIEVIAAIVVAEDGQNIAKDINNRLRSYLQPNNPKQSEGNQKGLIIINEVERRLANTGIDYIQAVKIGLDAETAYEQNFAFNCITQRVKLGRLKVTLFKDSVKLEYDFNN